jgi:hypothetical protein
MNARTTSPLTPPGISSTIRKCIAVADRQSFLGALGRRGFLVTPVSFLLRFRFVSLLPVHERKPDLIGTLRCILGSEKERRLE